MTFPKARLVVSACLFVGWLVFLFVLWLRSSDVILSHPQFMIAQVYAVVEIRDADGKPPRPGAAFLYLSFFCAMGWKSSERSLEYA